MDDLAGKRNIDGELWQIPAENAEKGNRADIFLAGRLEVSRAAMQKMMNGGLVTADGKTLKQNYRVRGGEIFFVEYQPPRPIAAEPENLPLDIIYEDSGMIVVNKARGMVVHPAPGNSGGTLVNALLYHCRGLSGINGALRPGIVHRLDKDTSGVMVVAKNDAAHLDLSLQIQQKTARREYLAIVRGCVKKDAGRVETLIGRDPRDRQKMAVVEKNGRMAVTLYEVLERFSRHTLVQCRLLTGRTHQIRVHMAHLGHPLLGDPRYLPAKSGFAINGQALHSARLILKNPAGEELCFTAPLPLDMERILARLRR